MHLKNRRRFEKNLSVQQKIILFFVCHLFEHLKNEKLGRSVQVSKRALVK